jgi:hypothetical protein
MTRIRTLALDISSWVTWLASPGCKDWAEGLEREVAFIGSDWRALGWALGSTRVLLDRRDAPLRSLAEVPAVAQEYFHSRRREISVAYFSYIFFAVVWALVLRWSYFAPLFPNERIGTWLVVAGCLFVVSRYYVYRRQAVSAPVPDDLYEYAVYYQAELRRDFKFKYGQGTRFCFEAVIWGSCFQFTFGSYPRDVFMNSFVVFLNLILLATIILSFLRIYTDMRKLQRRIDDLGALLTKPA